MWWTRYLRRPFMTHEKKARMEEEKWFISSSPFHQNHNLSHHILFEKLFFPFRKSFPHWIDFLPIFSSVFTSLSLSISSLSIKPRLPTIYIPYIWAKNFHHVRSSVEIYNILHYDYAASKFCLMKQRTVWNDEKRFSDLVHSTGAILNLQLASGVALLLFYREYWSLLISYVLDFIIVPVPWDWWGFRVTWETSRFVSNISQPSLWVCGGRTQFSQETIQELIRFSWPFNSLTIIDDVMDRLIILMKKLLTPCERWKRPLREREEIFQVETQFFTTNPFSIRLVIDRFICLINSEWASVSQSISLLDFSMYLMNFWSIISNSTDGTGEKGSF